MRDISTKNQLKEKSLDARIILSNTWHALFCSYSVNSEKFSVVSPTALQSHAHCAFGSMLAAPPSCPELHTSAWCLPGVGGALARLRRRALRRPNHRNGRQGTTPRQNAIWRHPTFLVAPRGHLLASACMQHCRRGLARAERALYRRRAVRPFRRGQAVILPPVLSWTLGRHRCFT